MLQIVVLNPKGGSGKTTLSTNLASYFARQGKITTLMDLDPQSSSVYWAHQRPSDAPHVQLVDAHNSPANVTRSWAIQPSRDTEVLIVDTPARPDMSSLGPLLREATGLVIPVLPSNFDVQALQNCLDKLTKTVGLCEPHMKIAVVINKSRRDGPAQARIRAMLQEYRLPLIACLRDTQNFIRTAEAGLGIFEMKGAHYKTDKNSLTPLMAWCESLQNTETQTAPRVLSPELVSIAANA